MGEHEHELERGQEQGHEAGGGGVDIMSVNVEAEYYWA